MRVLGIETSCDETAAAVVTETGRVLSDVVHSQVAVHAPFGGVVPELASRDHLTNAVPVIRAALAQAKLDLGDLDGVSVTTQPGLSGALLVGIQVAQGLAWALRKPLVAVDHLVGHLLSAFLEYPSLGATRAPAFPYVALIVSGGHTALYRVEAADAERIFELGATRDDAAGEAFDKVAKLLGLGYPGGPVVDRLAAEGDPDAIELALPMAGRSSLEFSFSGLKTNVVRWVEKHGRPGNDQTLRDLCAAFQRRVVQSLTKKTLHAAVSEEVRSVVVGGGVAANRGLRAEIVRTFERFEIDVVIPPFRACTDNAAMIAYAGAQRLLRGEDDSGRIRMSPRTRLPRRTKKGRGRR